MPEIPNKTSVVVKYPAGRFFNVSIEGDTHPEILENVFAAFNHGSGQEHPLFVSSHARSFSVNDLVKIDRVWYQCQSVGWTVITENDVTELELAVLKHPSFALHGAWFALSEVMWGKLSEKKSEASH